MNHIEAAELLALGALPDGKYKDAFKKAQFTALYRYERIWHEQQEIGCILEGAGIPYMPLTGALMRQCYPEYQFGC